MTFDEWSNDSVIEEDVNAIDFCYHADVWDLMERAFEAGRTTLLGIHETNPDAL
jgi:hypothetical protein